MTSGNPRVYLHRLGCAKLDVDNDLIEGGLGRLGVELVESSDSADTVIVSTCAFIGDAQAEAVEAMLEAVEWKQQAPGRRLYVTGCMPARFKGELAREIPEVDGWFGSGETPGLFRSLRPEGAEALLTGAGLDAADHPGRFSRGLEERLAGLRSATGRVTANLKIAEGCDRRCAYCAIPTIRGGYQSRRPGSILSEASRLLVQGVREIVVTAEEVNSFGRDLGDGTRIETLLPRLGELVAKHDGWLRVLYTHPPLFTDSFVEALRQTPALTPYLDFPIEHADDRVLKAMGRATTWARMRHWIERLRESIDGIALRTSVIVGHAGEGDLEFATLLERLEEARFDRLGVFQYSAEEGTRAAIKQAVDREIATDRAEEVMSLAFSHAEEWYRAKVGCRAEMLVELSEAGIMTGRSVWDAPEVDGDAVWHGEAEPGQIVTGIVSDAEPFVLHLKPLAVS